MIGRRSFLKSISAGIVAYPVCELMASPVLSGRKRDAVPFAGLDGWSMSHGPESKTEGMIQAALEQGFTFFDTANYDLDGRTERRYGKFLIPQHRDRVFIQSKTNARSKAVAAADVDLSLARLQTDYIDSYLMESEIKIRKESFSEAPAVETFEGLLRAREAGKVRRIGVRMLSDKNEVMLNVLRTYGDLVDLISVPFGGSEDDEVIQLSRKHGIDVMLNMDSDAQRLLLQGQYEKLDFPAYAASWIVGTGNPRDIERLSLRMNELI